jgi:nitrous oxide reductase accessory protein NosL
LVPLASEKAAKEFMKDHKGKKILKFNEVNAENLK